MASDTLLRLKVDSTEYEGKIKRAQQGLQALEGRVRELGGTFEYAEKEDIEFTKALGQMETVSKSTSGKIGELRKAFVELSAQYNRLTDEEKKSPFGKALAGSLNQLKGRIKDSEVELKNINGKLKDSGMSLESFSEKMTGMGIGALTKYAGATAAASAALKVAKDAFFQSESNIDEWGRTVEGAKGAYNTFLDTINGGNWSNFFSNLQKSIKDSRDLYDALDRLGSIKANNQAAISIKENTLQQLRLQKQNATDPDRIAFLNEQIAKVSQDIASLKGQSPQAGMAAGRKQIENTISSAFNGVAGAGTLRKSELNRIVNSALTQGQGYFDQQAAIYAALREKGMETFTTSVGGGNTGATQTIEQREFNIEKLTAEERKQYAIAMAVTEGETRIQQGISSWAAAADEGAQTTRELVKNLKQTTTGGTGGSGGNILAPAAGSMDEIKQQIAQLNKDLSAAVTDEARRNIRAMIAEAEERLKGMQAATKGSGIDLTLSTGTTAPTGASMLADAAANIDTSAVTKAADAWKSYQENLLAANQANQQAISRLSQVGMALQQIENPVAKVMGIVAEAIATIALAASKAINAEDTTESGWAWIGAAAAITGVMVSSISAVKSATSGAYANGGEIKGNSYSGDNLRLPFGASSIAVNAGEYVFNRAQMGNLASQLMSQDRRYEEIRVVIENDQLVGTLRNAGSRSAYHVN